MRFCNMELAESNMKQTVRLRDMAEILTLTKCVPIK